MVGYIEEYDKNMKKIISQRKVPLTENKIKEYIKWQSPFNHMTVCMRKSKLIEIGNYNENIWLEDYELWARYVINNVKMMNIDKVLVKVRTGKEMYKRRSGFNRINKIVELEKKLLEYKIINKTNYYRNIVFRGIFALIPFFMKKNIYKKIIRKL